MVILDERLLSPRTVFFASREPPVAFSFGKLAVVFSFVRRDASDDFFTRCSSFVCGMGSASAFSLPTLDCNTHINHNL